MRTSAARAMAAYAIPGGAVLLMMTVVLHWHLLPLATAPLVDFYRYSVLIAGLLLAWRFSSSQTCFALLLLGLADGALLLANGQGTGPVARNLIGLLLPVNIVLLAFGRAHGFNLAASISRATALFVQAVVVVALCRPEQGIRLRWMEYPLFPDAFSSWTGLPQLIVVVFAMAAIMLFAKYLIQERAMDSALLWALIAAGMALRTGVDPRNASAYLATGGLILVVALVEASYRMAFHDELTGLPGRRAFNHALMTLTGQYAVVMVDVDHFKQFNDTFGHDTGDQVLRMVASRLARVTGGGQSFRCGGEEFAVLFPGKTANEASPFAESLRMAIAESRFTVRGPDRSRRARPERRRGRVDRRVGHGGPKNVGVTVSMGIAEPCGRMEIEKVVRAADQALYRAKQNGRNRVEIAAWAPRGGARAKAAAKR